MEKCDFDYSLQELYQSFSVHNLSQFQVERFRFDSKQTHRSSRRIHHPITLAKAKMHLSKKSKLHQKRYRDQIHKTEQTDKWNHSKIKTLLGKRPKNKAWPYSNPYQTSTKEIGHTLHASKHMLHDCDNYHNTSYALLYYISDWLP